jgi:predicted metalloprotease with PDZ domain
MRLVSRRLGSRVRMMANELQTRLGRASAVELVTELRNAVARGEYPPPKRFAQAMRLLTEDEEGKWPTVGVKVREPQSKANRKTLTLRG